MSEVYIVDAVRTPVGKLGGSLAAMRPDDLAATVVRALVERNPGLEPGRSTRSTSATPTRRGEDNRNVARMAVLLAGLPTSVPGATVNRLCGSGMEAAFSASRAIAVGDEQVCIAGGVESMSRAPWVVLKPEQAVPRAAHETMYSTTLGWRMVNPAMPERVDGLARRGRRDPGRPLRHLARAAGRVRARESSQGGRGVGSRAFADEVVRSRTPSSTRDENIRADTTLEQLAQLKPVFRKDGTVTAGNSSPLNDGAVCAAAVDEASARHGREPLARIVARGRRARSSRSSIGIGPVEAANKALRARRHRLGRPEGGRAQRGVRRAVARLPGRVAGARPRDRQRQRRRDRPRAPARQLGRAAADHARPRAAPAGRRLGAGGDVHRRRPGSGDGDRGMNGYRPDVPGTHPDRNTPEYKSTRLRAPDRPLRDPPADAVGDHRAGVRPRADRASSTTTSRASTRASRSASGSSSPAACSTATAGRCATRSWRSGSATPPGATSTRSTSTPRRWTRTSPAPAGR